MKVIAVLGCLTLSTQKARSSRILMNASRNINPNSFSTYALFQIVLLTAIDADRARRDQMEMMQ
jgi:hypothetical protein